MRSRWKQVRKDKNYSYEQMLKYLGVSSEGFRNLVSRRDPKLNTLFDRFLKAPPRPASGKKLKSRQDGSLDLAPKTRRLLPQVGEVLERNGSIAKVVRVVNDTDIEVDVQYVPNGPWFRKSWTVRPHSRMTDEGTWEATGETKGKR